MVIGLIMLGSLLLVGPVPVVGGMINGTIIRSFPSPLGVGTHGIAMDNDGVHAWINKRGGTGQFTQIDLLGNEVPSTRSNTPVAITQGFEMDSGGKLWLIDRSSNDERALQMNTAGGGFTVFPLQDGGGSFFDNPNDLTLRNGDLYVVAPLDAGMHHFLTDGTFVETVAFQSGALDPAFPDTDAITYDGTNFWVAFGNSTPASKVFEIAPDGTVLSSFLFGTRLLGLSYDPTNDHLLATNGNVSDTIFVIGVPEPTTLSLLAAGGLMLARRRR